MSALPQHVGVAVAELLRDTVRKNTQAQITWYAQTRPIYIQIRVVAVDSPAVSPALSNIASVAPKLGFILDSAHMFLGEGYPSI